MGDRPSWREIDKMRDSASGGRRGGRGQRERDRRSRSSKAELDRLFSSGKLGSYITSKEKELEIQSDSDAALVTKCAKALRIQDRAKFLKEAEKILTREGVPSDFAFLERALELPSLELVRQVLLKLIELLESERQPDRSRALKVQLKMLPVKFGEPELETLGKRILTLLK